MSDSEGSYVMVGSPEGLDFEVIICGEDTTVPERLGYPPEPPQTSNHHGWFFVICSFGKTCPQLGTMFLLVWNTFLCH